MYANHEFCTFVLLSALNNFRVILLHFNRSLGGKLVVLHIKLSMFGEVFGCMLGVCGSLREENSISIHWGPNSFLHISRHAKKSLALDERISQLTWTGLIQGVFKLIPAMRGRYAACLQSQNASLVARYKNKLKQMQMT
jgi:hypothetical protein